MIMEGDILDQGVEALVKRRTDLYMHRLRSATILLFLLSVPLVSPAQLRLVSLRCEYAVDPLCVEAAHPQLSWVLESSDPHARGQRQTAYRIEAASSLERLETGRTDLWSAGVVRSDRQIGIAFA